MLWIKNKNVMDKDQRKQYFLRKPVEYRIQQLVDTMNAMSKEYKEMSGVGIAYGICADQLQDLLTQIKRDDNHQITILKNAENIKMFEVISDQLFNNKKK
jgi:bacterioferritin-associated ferredoxin